MSALDDLLLKKYHESIGQSETATTGEGSEKTDSENNETSYVSSESCVSSEQDCTLDPTQQEADSDEGSPARNYLNGSPAVLPANPKTGSVAALDEPPVAAPFPNEMEIQTGRQPAPAPSESPTPFKPDWEIDRFPWPAICDEIKDRVDSELGRAISSIEEACENRGGNTIILTSARSGSGRTTMTLCLAREAARQGKSVAIVDLDHAGAGMLDCMGIEFEHGIESLQQQNVTAESICVTAVEEGISLLPTANPFHPEHCVTPETRDMLRTVSGHHDLVLIDASREVADLIANQSDVPTQGMIMVSDPDTDEATQAFIEWMKEKNAWTLGVIDNFAA